MRKSMKQRYIQTLLLFIMMLVPLVSSTTIFTDSTETCFETTCTNTVLTLIYNGEEKYYTLEDLSDFDSITGTGGRLKVTGTVSGPYEYTGILISTLAQEFPSMSSEYGVIAIADDGYTMSYDQDAINGDVMVYDTDGNEQGIGGVHMILATKEDGNVNYPGSYRVAFINEDEPITDSFLWSKYIVELEFFSESNDHNPPALSIQKPTNAIYIFDKKIISYSQPLIVGEISIEINSYDDSGVTKVLIAIDEVLKQELCCEPYIWTWDESLIGSCSIEAIAYDTAGNVARISKDVMMINPF